MHKHINDHRIHTLVALDQENLYYVHETRDSANTSCANIITVYRSELMKTLNPGVLSEVRILYPPRMAGHSGFVRQAIHMGENLLRNAIELDMNPEKAVAFFKKKYLEGINCYGKYFKDNYDGMHMSIGFAPFAYVFGCTTSVTIKLYYEMDHLMQRHFENSMCGYGLTHRTRPPYSRNYYDTDVMNYIEHDLRIIKEISACCESTTQYKRVSLIDCAPPNLKKLCDSLIDGSVKGDLTGVPVVSIAREAVKEYNELEAKYQSACGQISEYEEENRKLKEKLEEISKLVKTAIDPKITIDGLTKEKYRLMNRNKEALI